MENWDLYTYDRRLTGKTVTRGQPIPEGYYYMSIHVCIFNSRGQLLIQKRTESKRAWPGVWDLTAGGGSVSGDTSAMAIKRELREELGLDISFEGQRPFLTVHFEKGFDDIYVLEREVDTNTLTLQEEEVSAVRWANLAEILEMIDSGAFVPYHKPLIELIFAMRKKRDAITS